MATAADIVKQIEEYFKRESAEYIILASPAFWKEEVFDLIKKKAPEIAKKITLASCNTIGKTGFEEILKRDEVKSVLKLDRSSKETAYVEELFKEISKQGPVTYGFNEVKVASDAHAIKMLLVTDAIIHEYRDKGTYPELDKIMKEVDRTEGDVHIISTDHEAGEKLQGIGGIGAVLRYKLY